MPANAQSFFNQILKIASFDIVDLTPRLEKMLRLNATEPLNPSFEALGFGSLYFLNNMNSFLLGFTYYFSLLILSFVLDRIQARYNRLTSIAERLKQMLFYSMILSMLNESYL